MNNCELWQEHQDRFAEYQAKMFERYEREMGRGCICCCPAPTYTVESGCVSFAPGWNIDPDCPMHGSVVLETAEAATAPE